MATAAIGQDRIVGGMHYQSDVIASRTLAQILLASLSADPKFQADLEAVRP